MLHIMYQGHQSIGSEEKDFLEVFTIHRHMVVMLFIWPGQFKQMSAYSSQGDSTWNLVTIGQVALEQILERIVLWKSWVMVKERIDLLYSQIFMYLLGQLYIQFLGQNLQNCSWKAYVLAIFPYLTDGWMDGWMDVIIWKIMVEL